MSMWEIIVLCKKELFIIGLVLLGLMVGWCCLTQSIIKDCRKNHNMILIKDGYCYDKNTHIIYIESCTEDRTMYCPYYNTDGVVCKYKVDTKEWVPANITL